MILISIDTLRPDHLGFHGYERPTSPHLDALAAVSTVFDRAVSTSPWTLPSHASMLTGLYPNRHGLKSYEVTLPAGVQTLARVLGAAGWKTAAIVNSQSLGTRSGLDRDFESFEAVPETPAQLGHAARIHSQAMLLLETPRDRPLFLFLHHYDVHSDYRAPRSLEAQFARSPRENATGTTQQMVDLRRGRLTMNADDMRDLIDLYDASIRDMDGDIAALLSFLERGQMLDRTLLVITSDHGEEFQEHGGILHGRTQYEEILRVPLLLHGFGVPAGLRIEAPVSLIDVMPTILGIVQVDPPPDLDGVDLSRIWRENEPLRPRTLFGEADHNNEEDDVTRSVRKASFKLHYDRLTGRHRLFDLSTDPGERKDIASEHAELAQQMLEELRVFDANAAAGEPRAELSEKERAELEALGYAR